MTAYFSFKKNTGAGHFGTVFKGEWRKFDGTIIRVAVKTLRQKNNTQEGRVRFLQEAVITGQFVHANVLRLHGVVFDDALVNL